MTEKRFTGEFKKQLSGIYDNGNQLTNFEVVEQLNELHDEKEFWKSNCVSQDNFNHILLHELDIAREQGYKVSNPFKKLMEKKEWLKNDLNLFLMILV